MNEIERILALIRARRHVETLRNVAGLPWDRVKDYRLANPLRLSARQLARIYEGEDSYQFDEWKKEIDKALEKPIPRRRT